MYVEHLHLTRSFAFSRVFGSKEEHDLHVHDCLEVGVVLKHELEYKFGENTYYGKPGDVFLCRPFEPHWSFAKDDDPFECILVLFTPTLLQRIPNGNMLLAPFYTTKGVAPLIPANTRYANRIQQAARKAVEVQECGMEAWVTRQYMYLIEILLQIHDFIGDYYSLHNPSGPSSEIMEIVGYLLGHYQNQIDIQSMSSLVGLGRTTFYNEFRNLTGLSPNQFINQLRIQHAMDILTTENQSMIDIAYNSGFQSLSTFNKQFKKYTGLSPREYRKKE